MSLQEHTYDSGQERKKSGTVKILTGNGLWAQAAIERIKALPVGWTGTGEDIRHLVSELPSHPNAWGGLIARVLKDELIYPTGDYRPMKDKSSNARKTPVYERM
jgi:hypothetical protein